MKKPEPFTPFLFHRRKRVWTIVYPDPATGKKKQHALPFRGDPDERGPKEKADKALKLFVERLRAGRLVEGNEETGPMTVARWAGEWLQTRRVKGISTVDDYESRLRVHILPHIGHLRIDKVTPEQIADVMVKAKLAGLAPRTQRHVYFTMRTMFEKAVPRLLDTNPCHIHTEDLPQKKDADPEWRANAIFTREEVQLLLTSPLIPLDRRVFYAVMFLAGMRFGEVSALHWRHYRPELEPLGALQVSLSYNSNQRRLKEVKTDRPRRMPVHPWLARILDEWRVFGWAEMMGRAPTADDIMIPTRRGTHRGRNNGWQQLNGHTRKNGKRMLGDLERLGMRPRRQHDTRRTLITLARADGAQKDLLRLCTHGPEGDIVDVYTEMPWAPLCAEIAKLRLGPPAPPPLSALPNPAESLAPGCQSGCHSEKDQEFQEVIMVTPPGLETGRNHRTNEATGGHGPQVPATLGGDVRPGQPLADEGGQSGPTATMATLALRQALAALERGRIDQATEILRRAVEEEKPRARGRAS